jgi:hypothetical protein
LPEAPARGFSHHLTSVPLDRNVLDEEDEDEKPCSMPSFR